MRESKITISFIHQPEDSNFDKNDAKAFSNIKKARSLVEGIKGLRFQIMVRKEDVNMVYVEFSKVDYDGDIGSFILYNDDSFGREKCFQIQDFEIEKEFRGNGIATYVMKRIAQNAKKCGMYLYTETLRSNVPMWNVLYKAGFSRCGIMRFPKGDLQLFELVPTTE